MNDRRFQRMLAASDEAVAQLRTIGDMIRYGCTRYEAAGVGLGHGTSDAYDEVAWLTLWALRLPPDSLGRHFDARLTRAERVSVAALFERRCRERVPAAYLTGEAWLRGRRFNCDRRALVPRSPIAEAIEESLPQWIEAGPRVGVVPSGWPESVLDLCTGSASLAIIAAQCYPEATIVGVDLSEPALALARENRSLHGLDDRIELVDGDLFDPVGTRRFDLIVCNPPYVNDASMRSLPPEFRAEPRNALAGGADGMELVRRILTRAPEHLTNAGVLVIEIGNEAVHFETAFPRLDHAYLPVEAGDRMLVLATREQLAAARAAVPR